MTDEGIFYYVMKLLDGQDLSQPVRRGGPVPAERVVHFLPQMCDSLARAYEAGLIHRDIKPASVYAFTTGARSPTRSPSMWPAAPTASCRRSRRSVERGLALEATHASG